MHIDIDLTAEAILAPRFTLQQAPQCGASLDTETDRNLARAGLSEISRVPHIDSGGLHWG
jgi:hypothetical protein